eukprot:1118516-Pyramimonas_sp.AAC.1
MARRNFLDAFTLLVTSSRVASVRPAAREKLPVLLLLDFGNAFPSLTHLFLWPLLDAIALPTGP